ncbi:pyridoxal-phosphate-dependent aminotransferase family protein [Microbacterium saperdae]
MSAFGDDWAIPLDPTAFPATRYARLSDRLGAVLAVSDQDVVIVPGEAIVALEAVAREAGASGRRVLNIATSLYGRLFGEWLAAGGAPVTTVSPEVAGQPIDLETVRAAILRTDAEVVAVVHGEAATGILNPLTEIIALAREHGAVTIVDAVASVGGEPLALDTTNPDITVIGPQKSLGGPAGLSAVAVGPRGWELLTKPVGAASFSSLSLIDLRREWLGTGRTVIPGTPHAHDLWALEAALDAVENEGIPQRIARHRRAALAARRGIAALGLDLWVTDDARASALTTTALLPAGIDRAALVRTALDRFGVAIAAGPADVDGRLIRVSHIGRLASFTSVLAVVAGLGAAIGAQGGSADVGAAAAAVAQVYARQSR